MSILTAAMDLGMLVNRLDQVVDSFGWMGLILEAGVIGDRMCLAERTVERICRACH